MQGGIAVRGPQKNCGKLREKIVEIAEKLWENCGFFIWKLRSGLRKISVPDNGRGKGRKKKYKSKQGRNQQKI